MPPKEKNTEVDVAGAVEATEAEAAGANENGGGPPPGHQPPGQERRTREELLAAQEAAESEIEGYKVAHGTVSSQAPEVHPLDPTLDPTTAATLDPNQTLGEVSDWGAVTKPPAPEYEEMPEGASLSPYEHVARVDEAGEGVGTGTGASGGLETGGTVTSTGTAAPVSDVEVTPSGDTVTTTGTAIPNTSGSSVFPKTTS